MTRAQIEELIERAIDMLDALDGDPDLVACEDEGWDSDSEPPYHGDRSPEYAEDQRVIITRIGGCEIAKRYA